MKTILGLAVTVALLFTGQARPDADRLRARRVDPIWQQLEQYLRGYEPQLSAVVADERMTQKEVHPGPDAKTVEEKTRIVASEVAFIALPADAGWLGFRRALSVDGTPLTDTSATLAEILAQNTPDSLAAARRLLADSASHNLGLPRTTNLPNLPLEFLHPRNAARFHRQFGGMQSIRGARTTRLLLIEQVVPTLIQDPTRGPLQSVVTAWAETGTGRLLRAEVKSRAHGGSAFTNVIRVEFVLDRALAMLVPSEMHEEFPVLDGKGSSVARYSNFRRFQTSARIVPQQ